MNTESNKPVDRVDVYPVYAAIWRNNSDKGPYYSVTFEKRYRDKDGNWTGTQSFSGDDLLQLAKAADRAHDRILELQREKSAAKQTVDA